MKRMLPSFDRGKLEQAGLGVNGGDGRMAVAFLVCWLIQSLRRRGQWAFSLDIVPKRLPCQALAQQGKQGG